MEPDSPDREVETLLRASRPVPRPVFEAELERRLFAGAARPARARRPLLAGAAAVTALAALFGVLGLAGSGPLSGGDDSVRAGDDCRWVTVTRPEPVPEVVRLPNGELQVRFKTERRKSVVRRCR
jgi:hypothetical protein